MLVLEYVRVLHSIGTHPSTARPKEVWLRQSTDSGLFVEVDWHPTVVSHLNPTFRQYIEMIVSYFCQNIHEST
jgi:hypothetical protein